MSIAIDVVDETEQLSEEQVAEIINLLQFVASHEAIEADAELSVAIVTNERIQQLNKEYRNKDLPTDVLSFAMEEEIDEMAIDLSGFDMPRVLGDIIISIDKIKEQAEAYGHSFQRELAFLSVHGFLHLLGYDHEGVEEEKVMFTKQKELLDAYGLER